MGCEKRLSARRFAAITLIVIATGSCPVNRHALAQHTPATSQAVRQPAATAPAPAPAPGLKPQFKDAGDLENATIKHLLEDSAWPRRAIAAVRLERFGCDESQAMTVGLLNDRAWQVRAFAIRTLSRRGTNIDAAWLTDGQDPRIIRDALRYRWPIALERVQRAVKVLAKSTDLEDKMLAAEIGAASGDKDLLEQARNATKQVILKMNRAEAGALSSRLAALTGQRGLYRAMEWQNWLMKVGRGFEVKPVIALEAGVPGTSRIAQLDVEQFAALDTYMTRLSEREVDLVICLDCTASMGRELAAAQGGLDDLMLFVRDMVASFRIAIVAYRDRGDEFETQSEGFTDDPAEARKQLWQLSADGGGDTPEAVYPALKLAYTQLKWMPNSARTLVLVGDSPPHIGYGDLSAKLAQRAKDEGRVTTHAIQAKNKEVKHFAEIAAAGGGRCVLLKNNESLVPEIAGLTLADRFEDEFAEFFEVYLELCR